MLFKRKLNKISENLTLNSSYILRYDRLKLFFKEKEVSVFQSIPGLNGLNHIFCYFKTSEILTLLLESNQIKKFPWQGIAGFKCEQTLNIFSKKVHEV